MLRKKFIFENDENDDENEKSDFQKILDLNKKRVHYSDVYFETSEGEDFSDYIETSQEGLIFTFDGVGDYLKFFFPEEYGDDNSDGGYDRSNYEWMYSGRWNWYDEFYDRTSDDWGEGYIVDALKSEHIEVLEKMATIASPSVLKYIEKSKKGWSITENKPVVDFLSSIDLEDTLIDIYIDAQVAAVENEVVKGIEKTYCDCLTDIGIERYSNKYCFWKYELDWGSAILLFVRFGTENDRLLDLLFEAIRKTTISHLPEYYEMQHYFWNRDEFDSVWIPKIKKVLEDKLEELEENIDNKEYYEVLDKVISIGGIQSWISTKDKKHEIYIRGIDPETLKITYNIREKNKWGGSNKEGITDIDSILNILNVGSLFDRMDYR